MASQPQSHPQPAPLPTLLNLPQPPSNPDTPSEVPGTPTSTTTSLSALSTTAIKDGHRGHHGHGAAGLPGMRGHQHTLSSTSLEAERADRISRLAGFYAVQTLRAPPGGLPLGHAVNSSELSSAAQQSPQTTPTSTSAFPVNAATAPGGYTPAYFDAAGQPVAATKMSTVGTASATESVGGRTTTGTADGDGDGERDTTLLDGDALDGDGDEDMRSMDTNYREADSVSGYMMGADAMDEDLDQLATRSVGGFDDHMSDDGNASLVGFGEGAGSTVSGPIYHRRPVPGGSGPPSAAERVWSLERSSSGLSEAGATSMGIGGGTGIGGVAGTSGRRDTVRELARPEGLSGGGGETPVSYTAAMERRDARMVDGVAADGPAAAAAVASGVADDDMFVDTTTRGPVSIQPPTSAIRETQQPGSQPQQLHAQNQHRDHLQQQLQQARAQAIELRMRQQAQEQQFGQGLGDGQRLSQSELSRDAVERMITERIDNGEQPVAGNPALGSPRGGKDFLGTFSFEK